MSKNPVAAGKVVDIHYQLKVAGEVLDSSEGAEPLSYLHGYQNIVPGLEKELTGKNIGDKLSVSVSPDEGYGERNPEAKQSVPRDQLPEELEPGMQLAARSEDGQELPCWIAEIGDSMVEIDFNHPLAGATLDFTVEIVAIRDAAPEEIEHGHVHGPHGHDHG
ncbi:MAG: peptidylprolyl isomerase [Planctomycetota bacterium]|nr:MAG: peptidylprolyl isomerase [Planctomycetota bacterium]